MKCVSYPLSPKNDYETWDNIIAKFQPLQEIEKRDPEELATIVIHQEVQDDRKA